MSRVRAAARENSRARATASSSSVLSSPWDRHSNSLRYSARMDSRAKQRLTGAVILVALFVLLVPELLTGPRNAGGDAPNEDGMRQYTIDLDAPAGNAQPMAPAEPAGAVALPPVAESPRPDNSSAAN